MPGVIEPSALIRAWPWSPGAVLALALASAAWVVADRRAGHPGGSGWWWTGLAVLTVALLSPLDTIADSLLSFHMVQHLLIGLLAPLLIVRARPLRVLRHLVSPADRRAVARWTARWTRSRWLAAAVVLGHVAVWWTWHVPALYRAAVLDDRIHVIEHAALFASGLALWALAWPAGPVRQRGGEAVVGVFFAALGTGGLAALITLSSRARYQTDAATAAAWGMTRLSDQQLAGALMWVPGGFAYLAVGVAVFLGWLTGRPARDPGLDRDRITVRRCPPRGGPADAAPPPPTGRAPRPPAGLPDPDLGTTGAPRTPPPPGARSPRRAAPS